MEVNGGQENTLRDFLRVIFRHTTMIITIIVITMTTVFVGLEMYTPLYQASVKMMISGQKETDVDFYKQFNFRGPSLLKTYTETLTSKTVLKRVVESLRLYEYVLDLMEFEKNTSSKLKAYLIDRKLKEIKQSLAEMTPEEQQAFLLAMAMARLEGQISILTSDDRDVLNFFTINVKESDPSFAVKIANVLSRSYVIFDIEQQIAELQLKYGDKYSTVVQLQNYVKKLHGTLDGKILTDIEAMGPASIKIFEQARTATLLEGRSKKATFTLAFFMSLFFGILLSFIFDFLNQKFKSPQDVEKFLNIPVLCSIPKSKSKNKLLTIGSNPENADYTRSFQDLSEQIYLIMKNKNLKSLLIADIEASKDNNNVIADLGIYLSHRGGYKVLIIDADLRFPKASNLFDISDSPGLIDVLEENIRFKDAVTDVGNNLHVLPTSKPASNPITLLDSSKMFDIINEGREIYDLILIMCPDLKSFSDAVILSSITDGTALIVNEGKLHRQVARHSIAPLEKNNVNIIGVIINNRNYVIPEIIYKLT